jgi:hypothetical protein
MSVATGNFDLSAAVRQRVWLTGSAVALALAGGIVHNLMEFGAAPVIRSANGEVVVAIIWIALFVMWWRASRKRRATAWAIAAFALLHLVAGAILTVLPLGFLPFEPEQSVSHYLAHVIYGVSQIPILLLALREIRGRGAFESRR